MSLDRWFQKRKNEILKRWKNNEVSYGKAASELMGLGYGVDAAYQLLEKT